MPVNNIPLGRKMFEGLSFLKHIDIVQRSGPSHDRQPRIAATRAGPGRAPGTHEGPATPKHTGPYEVTRSRPFPLPRERLPCFTFPFKREVRQDERPFRHSVSPPRTGPR